MWRKSVRYMLINLMVGIFSQCIHLSNDHVVHFKYFIILFVNYISIKVKKNFFQEGEQKLINRLWSKWLCFNHLPPRCVLDSQKREWDWPQRVRDPALQPGVEFHDWQPHQSHATQTRDSSPKEVTLSKQKQPMTNTATAIAQDSF